MNRTPPLTALLPPRLTPGPPRTSFPAKGYKTWMEGCSANRVKVNTTAFRVLRFNPGWSRAAGTCPTTACDSGAISSAGDRAASLAGIRTWGDAVYNQFIYVLPDPPCGFSASTEHAAGLPGVARQGVVLEACGLTFLCRVPERSAESPSGFPRTILRWATCRL